MDLDPPPLFLPSGARSCSTSNGTRVHERVGDLAMEIRMMTGGCGVSPSPWPGECYSRNTKAAQVNPEVSAENSDEMSKVIDGDDDERRKAKLCRTTVHRNLGITRQRGCIRSGRYGNFQRPWHGLIRLAPLPPLLRLGSPQSQHSSGRKDPSIYARRGELCMRNGTQ